MRIGVPKEIKEHELSVETGAGAGINATDQAYLAAGVTIVDTAAEIFAKSEMIVQMKEPQQSDPGFFDSKLYRGPVIFPLVRHC